MSVIEPEEISRLQAYLQKIFRHEGIALKMREKVEDSVEVIINGEFIGVIYKDEEDGDTSYNFNMAILSIDLNESA
ncbi:MAG: hypothetical protein DHS20C02_02730 [Micavibrio sp.]|nr:MAG: hypothetical protein DHS20C02_02730 [Micavibrio sp.]